MIQCNRARNKNEEENDEKNNDKTFIPKYK